ncbi:MAG: SCO family protein [Sphingobacteriaceae bacterium]|nr:SCO family protein [Sphingobacteriaceae bacterium]
MKSKLILNISTLIIAIFFLACGKSKEKKVLPVFGAKYVQQDDTVFHTIKNFSFTNQFNEAVTEQTVKNKIYVANFFFATCQSICPEMSKNLIDVQKAFANDDSVLILSHSVNPMHDSVEVLEAYANTYGALKNKWHLLTGDKKDIYALAANGYMVNAFEDDGSPEGFLHSEMFLLIDKKGRIRGMYDGTDHAEVLKLISDIELLKTESSDL